MGNTVSIKSTRRDFLRAAAIGGAGVLGMGMFGCSAQAEPASDKNEASWDEETDVVIVGLGGAGASACIEACNAGAEVIVFEADGMAGGCTALCGQMIAGAGTRLQEDTGIADDANTFKRYLISAGDTLEPMADLLATESAENIAWLEDLGVVFTSVIANGQERPAPGMQIVPRLHCADTDQGGIWTYLLAAVETSGADVRMKTPVSELVKDGNGSVVGVVADGKRVRARTGVIVSAGGFGRNVDMIQENVTSALTLCASGAMCDGSGLKMCAQAGAALQGWGGVWRAMYALDMENRSGFVAHQLVYPQYIKNQDAAQIQVNTAGLRIHDEGAGVMDADIGLMTSQPEGKVFYITTAKENIVGEGATAEPVYAEGATMEELAEKLGIDPEGLVATVEEWNGYVSAGEDKAFGRTTMMTAFGDGPFYGMPTFAGVLDTLAAPVVDDQMRVLDVSTREPISGLYAASAGMVGRTYTLCGAAVGMAIATGRHAGRNAAANKSESE